jgi:hypothetical protein
MVQTYSITREQKHLVINNLVHRYGLQPGYAIRAKHRNGLLPVMDHWTMYVGWRSHQDNDGTWRYQHVFALNMPPKARLIGEEQTYELLETYAPVEVQACYRNQPCNPQESANRAIEIINYGPDGYNLVMNNCQHFVSEATTGVPESYQVQNLVKVLFVGLSLFLGVQLYKEIRK